MVHTDISVIIPTLNAANTLEHLLQKLTAQKMPAGEIIIVDSGSTDQTLSVASRFPTSVITIEPDEFDHGTTRNLASKQARGSMLLFMTQDVLPVDSTLISNLVKPLHSSNVVVSYARQIAAPDASMSEKYLRLANYPHTSKLKTKADLPLLGIKTFHCSNACAAYRRDLFEKLGGFSNPVVCNEDMLFASKAIISGYTIAYTAEAVVQHTHHFSYKQLFKRYFDIAASLDHEPQIRILGRAEAKGLEYVKNYLGYIIEQKKLHQFPRVIIESSIKYLGYKTGENHKRIPLPLKKHLGYNTLYWEQSAGLN